MSSTVDYSRLMSVRIAGPCKLDDVVRDVLSSYPPTRDNDAKLVAIIWKRQMLALGYEDTSHMALALYNERLIPYETISRVRRRIQQQFPETRGRSYMARHDMAIQMRRIMKDDGIPI